MKKTALISLISLVSVISLISSPPPAYAKRLLPRVAAAKTDLSRARTSAPRARKTRGVTVKVKFRADRKAIIATFENLSIAAKVEYKLTYKSNGLAKGIVGSVNPADSDPTVRELLFGTCSAGVCRYDSGITGARFMVTTTLKSGRKVVKPFRLKV